MHIYGPFQKHKAENSPLPALASPFTLDFALPPSPRFLLFCFPDFCFDLVISTFYFLLCLFDFYFLLPNFCFLLLTCLPLASSVSNRKRTREPHCSTC